VLSPQAPGGVLSGRSTSTPGPTPHEYLLQGAPVPGAQPGAPTVIRNNGEVAAAPAPGASPTESTSPAPIALPARAEAPQAPTLPGGAAPGVTYNAQGVPSWRTGLSPLEEQSAKTRGTQLEDFGAGLQRDASSAVNSQFLIDQMRRESSNGAGWVPGRYADWAGGARSMFQGVFGDKMSPDSLITALGNYQSFEKNSMQLVSAATKAVSPRAAVQEMQMIKTSLPGAHLSETGLRYIFDQLSANNDFTVAKNQVADTWRSQHDGTLAGFDAAWNQSISPFAFLFHRMSNADAQGSMNNLKQTPEGRALIARIQGEIATGAKLGLFQQGGQ
jgi:hypothetical protein